MGPVTDSRVGQVEAAERLAWDSTWEMLTTHRMNARGKARMSVGETVRKTDRQERKVKELSWVWSQFLERLRREDWKLTTWSRKMARWVKVLAASLRT